MSEEEKEAPGSFPFPASISQGLHHIELLPCTSRLLPIALWQISTVWILSKSGSGQVTRCGSDAQKKKERKGGG